MRASSYHFIVFMLALFISPQINAETINPSAANVTLSDIDTVMKTKIQDKISQDSSLRDSNITVSIQQGIVTLDGTATSQSEVDTAVNDAKSIAFVKAVKSNILINNNGAPNPSATPSS
jgi:osmotically-inducible protein OsmY